MRLVQVRFFLALCSERNFTRAARCCGVSQPSFTQGIKKLETEIGGQLFLRGRNTTELTELGRSLRPYFAAIDRLADKIMTGPTRFSKRRRNSVNSVAAPPSRANNRSSPISARL
jgi:LysR family hydrogen peroxide-inducible transcriptional activator